MSQTIPIPRTHAAPAACPMQAPASLPAVGAFGAAAAAAATANANALARTSQHVPTGAPSVMDPSRSSAVSIPANGACTSTTMCEADIQAASKEDQLSTSWPPRPSLELVSRSARLWADVPAGSPRPASKFQQDFSEVALAVNSVRDALLSGRAGLERPPRESVSGTYFFRRVESGASVSGLEDEGQQSNSGDNVQNVPARRTTRRPGQVFVPSRVRKERMSQMASDASKPPVGTHTGTMSLAGSASVQGGNLDGSSSKHIGKEAMTENMTASAANQNLFGLRSLSADTCKRPGSVSMHSPLSHSGQGVFQRVEERTVGSHDLDVQASRLELMRPDANCTRLCKSAQTTTRERRISWNETSSGVGEGSSSQRPPVLTALSLGDSNATCLMESRGAWMKSKSAYNPTTTSRGLSAFAPRKSTSTKKKVAAVFKPADEEPVAMSPPESIVSSPSPVHPRGSPDLLDGNGSRATRMAAAGFHSGEGAFKEVAAYVLDHRNFAKVPQTALARCTLAADSSSSNNLKTKMGAFQVYVENVGDADDWGPGKFPLEDVHRIAILDIRTLNYDRHGGNILVTRDANGAFGLVPIDHAFTLPEAVQAVPWAVWMDWPAAKAPMSEETLHYIAGLEPDLEARMLHDELCGALRNRSFRSLKLATRLLQIGAAAGLSLYDIGLLIFAREGEGEPPKSEFQKIVDEALESASQRQSHLGDAMMEEVVESPPTELLFPLDGHVPPPSPPPPAAVAQSYNEDYIVKYACRLMDRLVASVVESKITGRRPVIRARSIPDFSGMGLAWSVTSTPGVQAPPPSPFKQGKDNITFRWASSPPRGVSGAPLVSTPPPLIDALGESSTGLGVVGTTSAQVAAPMAVQTVRRRPLDSQLGGHPSMGKSSPVSPPEFEWGPGVRP